jgi:hypothetical protein
LALLSEWMADFSAGSRRGHPPHNPLIEAPDTVHQADIAVLARVGMHLQLVGASAMFTDSEIENHSVCESPYRDSRDAIDS